MGAVTVSKLSGIRACWFAEVYFRNRSASWILSEAAEQGWQTSFAVWDTESFSKPAVADIWHFKLSGRLVLSLNEGQVSHQ